MRNRAASKVGLRNFIGRLMPIRTIGDIEIWCKAALNPGVAKRSTIMI